MCMLVSVWMCCCARLCVLVNERVSCVLVFVRTRVRVRVRARVYVCMCTV